MSGQLHELLDHLVIAVQAGGPYQAEEAKNRVREEFARLLAIEEAAKVAMEQWSMGRTRFTSEEEALRAALGGPDNKEGTDGQGR